MIPAEKLDPKHGPGRNPCRQALYNLGIMELVFGTAQGVHKMREAVKWFALAAEKGVLDSDGSLGRIV